jgi:radical SAM superfamily enzyme YgiQ (UPF0313 family)
MTGPMLKDINYVTKLLKEHTDIPIIVGGIHATLEPKSLLDMKSIDYIIRGEGELVILEIAKIIDKRKTTHKNILKLKNINYNPVRPFINMNDFPIPDYNLIDVKKYPLIMFVTSRGCPWGKCTFCYNCWGKKGENAPLRMYNAKNTIELITNVLTKYNIKEFEIGDDNFGLPSKRTFKVCRELEKYNIAYHIFQRTDFTQDRLMKALKKSGCWAMQFGLESGSQRILDILQKGTTVNQNAKAIKQAKKYGIFVDGSFIVGVPGETRGDINMTMDFIRKYKPDSVDAKILIPYPGIKIYEDCIEKGKIKRPTTLKEWENFYSKKVGTLNMSDIPTDILLKTINKLNTKSWIMFFKKFETLLLSGHLSYIKHKTKKIMLQKIGFHKI